MMLSFNQVEYLGAAMRSVLRQESVDLELIVVDPGSTDGSRELAQRIARSDRRVILIFEPDNGPADGLNKGFEKAQNEIVSYLNSDDIYLPGTLKKLEMIFNIYPHVDVFYGHGLILDEIKNEKLNFAYSDNLTTTKLLTNTLRIIQQSTFFRNESVRAMQLKFNAKNFTCWDFEFMVDGYLAGLCIKRIDDIFGILRIHSKSITGSKLLFDKYESDRNRILLDNFPNNNASNLLFRRIYSLGYRVLRLLRVLVLRKKFDSRIKEIARIETLGFME